jgi:hypothetical protein
MLPRAWAFFLVLFAPAQAESSAIDPSTHRPVVLVFQLAQSPDDRASEDRFSIELKLALDRFEIQSIDERGGQFAQASMPQRLKHIEELSKRQNVVATVWIEHVGHRKVLLNVVAMSTGRALIRIVEVESGPSAQAELALAAEELLGEAYLFSPQAREPALTEVVKKVKDSVAPPVPEEGSQPLGRRRLALMPFFTGGGGIVGASGPSLRLGGGLAAQLRLNDGLYGRLGLSVLAGPKKRLFDGVLSWLCVAPSLSLGYAWPLGPVRLGPVIEASLQWVRVDMALGKGDNQSFDWFNFHLGSGVEALVPLNPSVAIVVGGLIGLASQRKSFRRLSDSSLVLTSALIDWSAAIGFLVAL